MKFLGTGAGEGIPDPFCSCRICENARLVRGKEIRTRSSFMLDDETVIDLGADYLTQSAFYSVPFTKLKNVLFTHMHDDHINYTFIWERFVKRSSEDFPLNIYIVGEAEDYFNDFYFSSRLTSGSNIFANMKNVTITRLEFEETYSIGRYFITPLKGNHFTVFEKNAANYLIEKDGKSLYYAVDSGWFLPETVEALSDRHLTFFIGECTIPAENRNKESDSHMDITLCLKNLDRLYALRAIDENTSIYLTHIAPDGMTHAELSDFMEHIGKPYKVNVAYDNLELELL